MARSSAPNTSLALRLARKHLGGEEMVSSARLCMTEAVRAEERGELHSAIRWAYKSLLYSVGFFHPECERVGRMVERIEEMERTRTRVA